MRKNQLAGFLSVLAVLFIVSLMPASAGLLSFIDSLKTLGSGSMTGNVALPILTVPARVSCGDGVCQAPYEDSMGCPLDCQVKKNLFGYATQSPPPKAAKKDSCKVNGVLDTPEIDVDCGTKCLTKCSLDKKCATGKDCASKICGADKKCAPAKTCSDKKLTKGETDLNCGGVQCGACDLGKLCKVNSDCKSGRCDTINNLPYLCVSCSDGIRNGDESDKDCGGTCPNKCNPSQLCNANSDCKEHVCAPGWNGNIPVTECKFPACNDKAMNGDETDVDCGGSCLKNTGNGMPIQKCEVGQGCKVPADCNFMTSNNCVSGKCAAATCQDGQLNQAETDVDCGGTCGNTCGTGKLCAANADCQSANCEFYQGKKQCLPTPTCSDGRQNQGETDIDCGGPMCSPCGLAQKCGANSDCQTAKCSLGRCVSCSDVLKNGDESDVDCGGTCPNKCDVNKLCSNPGDCSSGVCKYIGGTPAQYKCAAPKCPDGVKNGDETDKDCGGSCTTKCADLRACKANTDCQLGLCDSNKGVCASCSDGVQDGDEVDVDCGGSCAAKCVMGDTCNSGADCASGNCGADGLCAQSTTCSNGVVDNGETDIDCGGVSKNGCNACAAGKTCTASTDCTDNMCSANPPTTASICQSGTYKSPVGALVNPPNCRGASGWACDPDDYTKPIMIRIYTGTGNSPGSMLQTVTASDTSTDASAQCGGQSAHGFSISSLPGNQDTLWIYADNIGAPGPGKLIGTRDRTCF